MNTRDSRLRALLAEMRRRHVGRITIAYAAAAFILLQAGEIILPAFEAPESVLRVMVVVVFLGFPIAVALAWVYEITPQGIRRTPDLDPSVPGRRLGGFLPRLALLGLIVGSAAAAGWWLVRWTAPEDVVQSSAPTSGPTTVSDENAAPIRSLAVLPLENYSEDGEPDYFSAGMHEALIYQLSQLEALRVVSRTSVMRYAGTTKLVPEIARELGVEGIIEGSVLRADQRVRITVQLIRGPTDSHLWSNSYERELTDIIALQGEVAQAIAREIQAELTPEEQMLLASGPPVNPEAHEAYLRGRFEQSKGTPEALRIAVEHYEDALAKDPTYAPALTSLAGSQLLLEMADSAQFFEMLPAALAAAEQAVVLDQSSAEAQAVLLEAQRRLADSDSVTESFEVVVQIDSLENTNEEWVAAFTEFGHQMQMLAANKELWGGKELSPKRQVIIAKRLEVAGEYEAAVALLEDVLERDPSLHRALIALEHVYTLQGDYEEAVAVRREHAELMGMSPEEEAALDELEEAVDERGAQAYWEWQLRQLRQVEAQGGRFSQVDYAEALVALGYYDEALDRLERAFRARDRNLLSLRSDPSWDPIRGDPRFRDLQRRIRSALVEPPAPAPRR